ncbi:transient receptor potential cation channel subfamily V member 5-like [Dreissena polymorpha]|uniref:transient receptor potential cation channel subfamily V member 5-like n=1 Tax=Dreissena polymorpha TaxID=45954 RepID=UPI002264339D|nr:transient receptor potential cation channel subfamily V member 5-like [Dreissena polymorpha]
MADDRNGETVLHVVVKWSKKENNNKCIEKLVRLFVKRYPELIVQGRQQNSEYAGQTPLHMAICKGNTSLVRIMLKYATRDRNNVNFDWHIPATGTMFCGTVMMGELSLSTAALTYNTDGMTPLKLAAEMGLFQIFKVIMNIEGVYCKRFIHDGLFVTKEFDVTEFDIPSADQTRQRPDENLLKRKQMTPKAMQVSFKRQTSILYLLMELNPKLAFPFISFLPVKTIIQNKWASYSTVVWILMFFHLFYMCFFTWYVIERSQQLYNSKNQQTLKFDTDMIPVFKSDIPYDLFTTTYAIISAVFATVYIAQDLLRMVKGHMRWTSRSFKNAYSNGLFRVVIYVFCACLLIDLFAAIWSDAYENYCLIVGIIVGWFLTLFFLRTITMFSQFSLLIHQVLAGDIFRFSIILAILLISFSTAMYMSIQGSRAIDEEEYRDYGRLILSMFKVTVGLGGIPNVYATKHSLVGSIIFVAFIIMTAVLIMNALIATMDQTSAKILQHNDDAHLHERSVLLQRLSMILFIESILPTSWIHRAGELNIRSKEYIETTGCSKTSAYSLEITALSTLH